jgi:hypothetical protein
MVNMARREPKGAMEIAYRKSLQSEEQLFGTQTKIEEEKKMTNAVTMVYGAEVAVVKLNGDNRVEVAREGSGTVVMAADATMDSVVKNFEKYGWKAAPKQAPAPTVAAKEENTVDLTKVAKSAIAQGVTVEVQQEVDAYLKLQEQKSALEKLLEGHKKTIRSYMEENNIKAINGTEGKQVYLQDAKASNSTSNFSDYEYADVMMALPDSELLAQVTEVRVSTQKLEGLLKLDKLPKDKVKEIEKLKIVRAGTPRFAVKK